MRKREKKIDYKENNEISSEDYPNLSNVVSANECTGLMPTLPQNGEEMKSYQHLSSTEIPRRR